MPAPYLDCLRSISLPDLPGLRLCHPRRRRSTARPRHGAGPPRDRIRLFIEDGRWARLARTGYAPVRRPTSPMDLRHRPSRPTAPPVGGVHSCPDACWSAPWRRSTRGRRVRPRAAAGAHPPGTSPRSARLDRSGATLSSGRRLSQQCYFWEDADLYFRHLAGPPAHPADSLYLHRASRLGTRLVAAGQVERAVGTFYRTWPGRAGRAVRQRAESSPWVFVSLGSLRSGQADPAMAARCGGARAQWDRGLSILVWALRGSVGPAAFGCFGTLIRPRLHRPSPFHRRPATRLATDMEPVLSAQWVQPTRCRPPAEARPRPDRAIGKSQISDCSHVFPSKTFPTGS